MNFGEHTELVNEYLEASHDFLDEFDRLLLELERSRDDETSRLLLAEILRHLHTFKGNSGMMGYASLADYAHAFEDIFKQADNDLSTLNEEVITATGEIALDECSPFTDAIASEWYRRKMVPVVLGRALQSVRE